MQVSYGGEDAHFISDVRGGALGVADGVGGWKEEGINPAGQGRAGASAAPACSLCMLPQHCSTHNPATCLSMHAEYSRSLMRVACSHLEAQQTIDPRVCGGKCNASSAWVCPGVLADRLIHVPPAPTCAYVFA